ncbi:hypothetical protein [Microbacterium sp. NPDC089696]|uniref:hypothetical protein n=1 Tax=Microbacterium sp. NPDC089696 TaxID=3364199 RepID=UPI0037F5DAC1
MSCPGLPQPALSEPLGARRFEPWWGSEAGWIYPLERDARRQYGAQLRRIERPNMLIYIVDVSVTARSERVRVRVEFHRNPPYPTYKLAPSDYPRVFADVGAESPHRLLDDSLCLYHPSDPVERRWTPDKGLAELLHLAARHLFAEDYWRSSNHRWPFDEAPHGLEEVA